MFNIKEHLGRKLDLTLLKQIKYIRRKRGTLLLFENESSNIHAVFDRQISKFCPRVLKAYPEA